MSHPNEQLLRREVKGVSAGVPLEDFYAEDVVLHYLGNSSLAGDYRGHEGLEDFFGKIGGVVSSLERELHDAVANDNHGVQLLTVRAQRKDGRKHEWQVVWVCHFRDGKISELWGHVADQQALDEFLAG